MPHFNVVNGGAHAAGHSTGLVDEGGFAPGIDRDGLHHVGGQELTSAQMVDWYEELTTR